MNLRWTGGRAGRIRTDTIPSQYNLDPSDTSLADWTDCVRIIKSNIVEIEAVWISKLLTKHAQVTRSCNHCGRM